MALSLSRYMHPYFVVRRFPIAERPRFGPEQTLRFAELLHELDGGDPGPERRARLLAERAAIEELAGRAGGAQASLGAAIDVAARHAPALLPELRYEQAKMKYRGGDFAGAQAGLEAVIAEPAASDLLKRRALLILGRVALDQGRFAAAIEALGAGLSGSNTRHNLVSGHFDLAYAHIRHAEPERAFEAIRAMERIADPADAIARVATTYYEGWLDFSRDRFASARASLERARDRARELPLSDATACCELSLAFLDFRSGRLEPCLAGCERVIALTGADSRPDLAITARLLRGRTLMVRGLHAAALEQFERAREQAAAQRRPSLECRAHEGLADVHVLAAEAAPARAAIDQSLALHRALGDRLGECIALANLAAVERPAGALDRAGSVLESARQIAEQIGSRYERARVCAETAELRIAAGDLAGAAAAAAEAARLYGELGSRARLAMIKALEARVLALQDRWSEALARADEAAGLVADDPCRIFLAEVLATRAYVLDDSGDADGAARAFSQAGELAAQCGAEALVEDLRRASEEVKERAFARRLLERYLDPRVVARLLARKERRLAESLDQEVAILFSDIRGYTSVSETLSPQEVVSLLNEHFDAMGEEVTRFGGVIDKFMGDAIMVVFGDPGRPRPDDAARAVLAAVAMVRRRHAMNRQRVAAGLPPIRIGVGVHYGPVILGHIGSRQRVSYTVVGDAVNVAARLETATKEHHRDILVSEDVARTPGQACPIVEVGQLPLKGRAAPVRVFAVECGPETA